MRIVPLQVAPIFCTRFKIFELMGEKKDTYLRKSWIWGNIPVQVLFVAPFPFLHVHVSWLIASVLMASASHWTPKAFSAGILPRLYIGRLLGISPG